MDDQRGVNRGRVIDSLRDVDVAGWLDRKRLANGLAVLVLLGIVAPFVVFAVPGVIGAKSSFVVLSGSMSPAISPGDVVIVESANPGSIEEGDIITFARENSETPITHRVVDVHQTNGQYTFETKGDANENPDPQPVAGANVIGDVVLVIPYIGHVIQFGSTALGMVLMIALPLGLLVLSEIRTLGHASRTRDAVPTDSGDRDEERPDEVAVSGGESEQQASEIEESIDSGSHASDPEWGDTGFRTDEPVAVDDGSEMPPADVEGTTESAETAQVSSPLAT